MAKRKKPKRNQRQERLLMALCVVLIFVGLLLHPSKKEEKPLVTDAKQAFIDEISQYAMGNYPDSHVLPSVVVAQAAIESDFGQSDLAKNYHNLFGYKATANETQVVLPTKEYVNGQWQTIQAPFKVYVNWRQAVVDHGMLMQNGTDWDPTLYHGVTTATNYQTACVALARAGYATDPNYANKLITIIEQYHLETLDEDVLNW